LTMVPLAAWTQTVQSLIHAPKVKTEGGGPPVTLSASPDIAAKAVDYSLDHGEADACNRKLAFGVQSMKRMKLPFCLLH